jgi:hypothetical protein
MKQQRKFQNIVFFLSFWTIIVQAQQASYIPKEGLVFTSKGLSDMMADSPSYYFIDTSAVVLEYPTLASISYEDGSGLMDYSIVYHLEKFVNPDNYDFIIVLSINEVPLGINAGPTFDNYPKNIGKPNNNLASYAGKGLWAKLRSMPLMNSVNWLEPSLTPGLENYSSTYTAFHEIGHHWGVYYNESQSITFETWTPNDPVGYLACQISHWRTKFVELPWRFNWLDRLGVYYAPGLMAGITTNLFNAFDLYNMGLMGYDEAKTYEYSILDSQNNPHKVNIDDLRYILFLKGDRYYEGDGKRIPSIDNEIKILRSLIVIVKGKDEIFTDQQKEIVKKLANDIPNDWNTATWGRSKMSVGIDKHLLNPPSIIAPINNTTDLKSIVQINWSSVIGASKYRLQIAYDSMFWKVVKDTLIINNQITVNLPKETYFARVRAENGEKNSAASKIVTFKTDQLVPILSTFGISDITSSSAVAGGRVNSEGGSAITERGICWSTSMNPTIKDNKIIVALGQGGFETTITGLKAGITYHFRAYATNSYGAGYSEDYAFTVLITGIHENLDQKILIYPNPTNGHLNIESNQKYSGGNKIDVLDYYGRIVFQNNFDDEMKHEFDLTQLQKGMYFVRIQTRNKNYYKKIIIE